MIMSAIVLGFVSAPKGLHRASPMKLQKKKKKRNKQRLGGDPTIIVHNISKIAHKSDRRHTHSRPLPRRANELSAGYSSIHSACSALSESEAITQSQNASFTVRFRSGYQTHAHIHVHVHASACVDPLSLFFQS